MSAALVMVGNEKRYKLPQGWLKAAPTLRKRVDCAVFVATHGAENSGVATLGRLMWPYREFDEAEAQLNASWLMANVLIASLEALPPERQAQILKDQAERLSFVVGDGGPDETATSQAKVPLIGHPWPEQGGTYCGTVRGREGQPDHHLILADAKPTEHMSWVAGMAWAKTVSADGHTDFDLPTRYESSVLFGNVGELFEPYWHWTSTQSSQLSAFIQYFSDGDQGTSGKEAELRVRAVRRLPINPSILSAPVAQAEEVAA